MKKLVLATANQHKVDEIKAILQGLPCEVVNISAYPGLVMPEEDRPTLYGNAALKSETVAAFCGEISLADDTGLEVDALDGRPGVLSARYAGPEADYEANNRLLLSELQGLPAERRTARFVTVIAITVPGDRTYSVEGVCPGRIATEPRGSVGFGYDPLFIYDPLGRTFAEIPTEKKNTISHRARALRQARQLLTKLLTLKR